MNFGFDWPNGFMKSNGDIHVYSPEAGTRPPVVQFFHENKSSWISYLIAL